MTNSSRLQSETVHLLQCKGLAKAFPLPTGRSEKGAESQSVLKVLESIDLSVGPRETVAIMGRSGGGKSTLLSCLAGLDQPTAGRVLWKGVDVSTLEQNQLNALRAQTLGIVFQQFHLIDHLTALENARLPLDLRNEKVSDSTQRAEEALRQVGLQGREDHLPHELSRGECQRVAIARVLVMRPQLILADEPTGSLDEVNGSNVMDLLFQLTHEFGYSLVLVTHDKELAARCQRQLKLSEGRLVPA